MSIFLWRKISLFMKDLENVHTWFKHVHYSDKYVRTVSECMLLLSHVVKVWKFHNKDKSISFSCSPINLVKMLCHADVVLSFLWECIISHVEMQSHSDNALSFCDDAISKWLIVLYYAKLDQEHWFCPRPKQLMSNCVQPYVIRIYYSCYLSHVTGSCKDLWYYKMRSYRLIEISMNREIIWKYCNNQQWDNHLLRFGLLFRHQIEIHPCSVSFPEYVWVRRTAQFRAYSRVPWHQRQLWIVTLEPRVVGECSMTCFFCHFKIYIIMKPKIIWAIFDKETSWYGPVSVGYKKHVDFEHSEK